MELLKIGDRLYYQENSRWTDYTTYIFATVDRLTKTQAVLSDGTKLINEPIKNHYDKTVGYATYGDRWSKWHFVTEEIISKAKEEKEKRIINFWFEKHKFTNEEKKMVYLKFKELDLLEPKG